MDNERTGKLIAELRKEKGFTQQQLADQLNLSNKTISKWESGAGSPDISILTELADVLEVTADELLRGQRSSAGVVEKPPEQPTQAPPSPTKPPLTSAQKMERAFIALFAAVGAILGILAYNYGWLG